MKLSFFGAAGEVTGSCIHIETDRARVLVDFGMHQGGPEAEERNRRFPPFDASNLDGIVVTHAHLDHTGRLPLLTRRGYDRPIHATPATMDLCQLLLRDAAQIQVADAARDARHGRPSVPLYDEADVEGILTLLRALPLGASREIAPGISVRLFEAGHILGAASVEMTVREGGATKRLVFSGDIGPMGQPLLRDFDPPEPPPAADLVVLESTYGDRDHRPLTGTLDELVQILNDAKAQGGRVLIPSFAIGRTQALIYHLGRLRQQGRINNPAIYIDSPMAIEATELYARHRDQFDDEAWGMIRAGDSPLRYPGLRFSRTSEQSRELNSIGGGAIIIAAAGMCNAGRIVHHLRHGLGQSTVHVVIAGYQAQGTLGRQLVELKDKLAAERVVRVFGDPVQVRAQVHTLGGCSAHAGQSDLLTWTRWMKGRSTFPKHVVLNHGEHGARDTLRFALHHEHGVDATLPVWGQSLTL
jgi:metallo-beta-lactamase family protein